MEREWPITATGKKRREVFEGSMGQWKTESSMERAEEASRKRDWPKRLLRLYASTGSIILKKWEYLPSWIADAELDVDEMCVLSDACMVEVHLLQQLLAMNARVGESAHVA